MQKYEPVGNEQIPTGPDSFADTLDRAQRGENRAVEAVFEQYKGLVRAKSRSYFLIGADNEDLIQEGMIGLYKAIRDYKPDRHASFSLFADICVTRQIISAIKTATRRKHLPLNTYISLSGPTPGGEDDYTVGSLLPEAPVVDPEAMIIDRERGAILKGDLKRLLSEFENNVLSLYLQGMTYEEMSERLKKAVKSVDNALQRVKRKLENRLATEKET